VANKVVVADAGPLIALALVNCLSLLRGISGQSLFDEVHVPSSILKECTQDLSLPGAKAIHDLMLNQFFTVHDIKTSETLELLTSVLDQGEADAIVLAKDLGAVLIIDEKKGRKVASNAGIPITGTAAVLLKAKGAGLIPAIKPLLDILETHGYRFSDLLIQEVLRRANEH